MIWPALRGIERKVPVGELDAAVGLARDVGIVRNHEDGVARAMELAEDFEHDGFVGSIEVAGRLIGENQLGLIDECASNGNALLLAAGELGGKMRQAVGKADAAQRFFGLRFVRDAVEVLRQHHVFDGVEIRDKMKLLEDEADFFRAVANEFVFAEL